MLAFFVASFASADRLYVGPDGAAVAEGTDTVYLDVDGAVLVEPAGAAPAARRVMVVG